MWKINKGKEPNDCIEYRNITGATYENIPNNVKNKLRTSLLIEQGYLCCYCMSRITSKVKIEHFKSQSNHSNLQLKYRNLFVACLGGEGQKKINQTCDTKKGDTDINSFNLINSDFENEIQYNKDGHIKSLDNKINKELNDILNLNNQMLKRNREAVSKGVLSILKKLERKKKLNKSNLIKICNLCFCSKDGMFEPFFAVKIYFLRKRLRKFP